MLNVNDIKRIGYKKHIQIYIPIWNKYNIFACFIGSKEHNVDY